ncbi:MAG: hypothetical protein BroJett011_38480 [Chloroflexota bacterium]|nr:MAG: hypothetical protein BroJett011_38480 [Chloroflexota bacterium]
MWFGRLGAYQTSKAKEGGEAKRRGSEAKQKGRTGKAILKYNPLPTAYHKIGVKSIM